MQERSVCNVMVADDREDEERYFGLDKQDVLEMQWCEGIEASKGVEQNQ